MAALGSSTPSILIKLYPCQSIMSDPKIHQSLIPSSRICVALSSLVTQMPAPRSKVPISDDVLIFHLSVLDEAVEETKNYRDSLEESQSSDKRLLDVYCNEQC